MALAFAAVLIAPRAYRPLVAVIGGAVALAVSFSILALQWHYPSDVVGGFLVATGWCCATLAALRYSRERWPERGTMRRAARAAFAAPSGRALAWAGVALAAVAILVALARAGTLVSFAARYTSFVLVAGAIAFAAAVLLAAVTTIASRDR
jgi:hypothetical protein